MAIKLSNIKNEIAKSGTSKGKFIFFKEGTKARIRFLTDFEDGMEIPFHSSYEKGINVPCQDIFGRECEYCDDEEIKTRNQYAWSVYDYESKEVKILMALVNNCSPVPALASLYESYGTLIDRDYEIKRIGKGTNTTYSVIPLEKMKFRNPKAKAMSDSAILKAVDKAYPSDNSEIEEEEESKKKTAKKANTKPKKQEVEEEEEWEEEGMDYSTMTAKQLYDECKVREIDCKPRKSKEYYIDLLEEYDEDAGEDEDEEWEEEEE